MPRNSLKLSNYGLVSECVYMCIIVECMMRPESMSKQHATSNLCFYVNKGKKNRLKQHKLNTEITHDGQNHQPRVV